MTWRRVVGEVLDLQLVDERQPLAPVVGVLGEGRWACRVRRTCTRTGRCRPASRVVVGRDDRVEVLAEVVGEAHVRELQLDAHGPVVELLGPLEVDDLEIEAAPVLGSFGSTTRWMREQHVVGRHRLAVVEGDAGPAAGSSTSSRPSRARSTRRARARTPSWCRGRPAARRAGTPARCPGRSPGCGRRCCRRRHLPATPTRSEPPLRTLLSDVAPKSLVGTSTSSLPQAASTPPVVTSTPPAKAPRSASRRVAHRARRSSMFPPPLMEPLPPRPPRGRAAR